jgi:site-specific recombinase XerD
MLRHACVFALANKGADARTIQVCLKHKSIQHPVRYAQLAPFPACGADRICN